MVGSNRRISKGRSRTGCITCKIRRVKCDERKPACDKCESTGRTCSGYADEQGAMGSRSPTPGEGLRIVQHVPGISQPIRMWQVSQSMELVHENEYRSLEFFQLHTTLCFGAEIGSFLLRAAYHEPIIRTIAIAIGSLHRSFVFGKKESSIGRDETFTLFHYNKAIRQLVAVNPQISPQTTDTFLIACILFFCFECLQSHYKSAFQHAISGLKIIKQQQLLFKDSVSSRYMPPETVTLLFSILENQILEIEGEEVTSFEFRPAILSSFTYPDIDSFSLPQSVEQGLRSFQVLYNRFARFEVVCEMLKIPSENLPFESLAQIQYIRAEFDQICFDLRTWTTMFDKWIETPDSYDVTNPVMPILKVWRVTIGIFLRLDWPPSELIWDKFTADFATINCIVADMVSISPADLFMRSSTIPMTQRDIDSPHLPASKPASLPPLRPKPPKTLSSVFSLSLGIVTPLYICATRCRQSSIRHQAIYLLSYCQRREGLWDSELAGRIANRIVNLEELAANIHPGFDYSPSDIPENARVSSLSPQLDGHRRIKIRYNRESEAFALVQEIFTW